MIGRVVVGGLLFSLVVSVRGAGPEKDLAPRITPHVSASSSPSSFAFTFEIPPLRVEPGPDGFSVVAVEGLDASERALGAPDLPTRTLLIAIPPDASPSLDVRLSEEERRPGVRPRAVGRRSVELSSGERLDVEGVGRAAGARVGLLERRLRQSYRPDPEIYEGDAPYPPRAAWLGATGVLRDQRYVEVHLAPVRFDPRIQGLFLHRRIEVVVHFNRSGALDAGDEAADDRFEDLYRETFVNYEQSRRFRGSGQDQSSWGEPPASLASAAGPVSTPRQRIRVDRAGIWRLDWALLQPTGFLSYDLSTWRLSERGVEVPLQSNDDGDGVLEPGEWVQFYGQALDDEPKTALNTDFPNTTVDLFEARDFTDVNTYFLTVEAQPVAPMPVRDAAPTFARTPPQHFRAVAHAEVDNAFRPLGAADPWYWLPTLLVTSQQASSRTDDVALPGLFSGTEPATLRVHVRGIDEDLQVNPDHLTRVTLRNSSNQTLALQDGSFDNRTLFLHELSWTWPGSGAQATNPLRVGLEVLPSGATCSGAPCNSVILDYLEVEYARAFSAIGGALLFDWPDEDAEFSVSGLADPTPTIYEITLAAGESVIRPVLLANAATSGAGPFAVRFRMDQDPALADGTPRRFVVIEGGATIAPTAAQFEADTVSDLRDPANQADLIVIAHPALLDTTPGGPLDQLLVHRASAAGGALTSKVVLLQDVYDEFQHGLPGPTAIREFLRWVMSDLPGEGWADPKPSYVLLLGDASVDYKSGLLYGDYVPTQIMYRDDPILGVYASDNVMTAVVGGDQLADLVVGRIPARSAAQANSMLQKIVDYEQSPPAGAWRDRTLFVSDRGKLGDNLIGESLEFELINAEAEQWIRRPPYASRNLRYFTDYFNTPDPTPWDSINADLKASVNGADGLADGVAIVNYIGHGNFVIWSDDFFWDERINPPTDPFQDSMDLANGGRLPWLLVHNCLTGGFHIQDHNSIGENWLKLEGGGAVGVFAPTGLSTNYVGGPASSAMFQDLFGPTKQRVVGPVVLRSLVVLCERGSIEACQYYALQGDPATRLVLHDVAPPTNVAATASDARVDLSWSASATAGATYDVYRADRLQNPSYTRVATGLAGTSFPNTGLTNTKTYYYYVVAIDPAGFDSAWSNFNSDCSTSGPDCVSATPLNPSPPAVPVGVQLEDLGVGVALRLTWLPNTVDEDLASYTVHYGTASGDYGHTVNAALTTDVSVTGLVEGQTYYFAVTATNTSGLTSGFSQEVNDYPVFGLGLRAPRTIEDLRARRQGGDVVLEWAEVTTDFYGKPETVAHYEILRGTSSSYDNSTLVSIGTCASPCTSFTDPGAAVAPASYHYRVRAVDVEGNGAGLGSNPPEPVNLLATKSTTAEGNLVLSWSPVTEAVDGRPTQVVQYRIYAADQPFTRENIRDGLLAPVATVAAPPYEFTPPPQNRYHSVLAVDSRGNTSPY